MATARPEDLRIEPDLVPAARSPHRGLNPGLIRALYNLALPPALLAALPGSLIKMKRRGGYGRDFPQRLGLYRPDVSARLASPHAPAGPVPQ